MTFLTDLDEVLRTRGVKVKTHPGWKTRGYAGMSFAAVRGTLWHHTATARSAFEGNDAPTLNLCMYGRSDLPGPLCQIVLGRDGTAHVIAAGWGNHAGYGSYPGIPKDQGNAYLIGVEMESSGLPPYDWTLAQLQAIPVLRDALRDGYGHKLDIAHYEWSSTGKIDPAGLPGGMNWLRTAKANSKVTAQAATPITPKDWFDMATEADLEKVLRKVLPGIIRDETVGYEGTGKQDLWSKINEIQSGVKSLPNSIKRLPIESRADSSKGKTYGLDTHISVNNANIWAIASKLDTVLQVLNTIAASETTPAQEIVNQIKNELASITFTLTSQDEAETVNIEEAK